MANLVLKRITGRTKIWFIIGDPSAHIVATALFNQYYFDNDIDASVSALNVVHADLPTFIQAIRSFRNVCGFGVTLPHKIEICRYLDHLSQRARQIGAVNFVRRDPDGSLSGDMVDGIGMTKALILNGVAIQGARVLQVGAGGVGRAIAFAIADAGACELTIANRSLARAENLAQAVQASYPACLCRVGEAVAPTGIDLVVNATSVGMQEGDPLPIDITAINGTTAVAEVIMSPETTALLDLADEKGCTTVRGKEMLIQQLHLASVHLGLQPQ
ncbi:MAG: shikimate dehydrogenase [Anaerolineales bacterium]|nr:shikimate dehydrogenase [Anaerolineales bacterium]